MGPNLKSQVKSCDAAKSKTKYSRFWTGSPNSQKTKISSFAHKFTGPKPHKSMVHMVQKSIHCTVNYRISMHIIAKRYIPHACTSILKKKRNDIDLGHIGNSLCLCSDTMQKYSSRQRKRLWLACEINASYIYDVFCLFPLRRMERNAFF